MENRILEGNYNNDTVVNIFFFGTGIARLTCPGRSRRPTQINKRIKKEQKKEKKREIKMEIKKKKRWESEEQWEQLFLFHIRIIFNLE